MALKSTTGKLEMTLSAGDCRRGIVIPSVGARLLDIIEPALPLGFERQIVAVRILPFLPSGSERGSFLVADPYPNAALVPEDWTDHAEFVAAGQDWATDSVGDLDSYLKAVTDTPAIAVIHW
jgi:hypothetical protein